jgi:hypothetical protein
MEDDMATVRHQWSASDDSALRDAVEVYDAIAEDRRPRAKWAWIAGASQLPISADAARGRMRHLEAEPEPACDAEPPLRGPGDVVIVRDHMAGVHVGVLVERDLAAKTCVLKDARKIWSWVGAGSCHGLAAHGPRHDGSRIAPPVSRVELCSVVEIVWCAPEGARRCMSAPEWRP